MTDCLKYPMVIVGVSNIRIPLKEEDIFVYMY